jgi:2-polyprenyl-3-methyl-5-hydroxy-6-metoxy-1,4-benzoquinol methylase
MSAHDRDHWDTTYERRIREGRLPPPDPLLLQFTPPPGPYSRALDMAAGLGQNSLWLAEQGYTVDMMDISRVALGHAYDEATARQLRTINFYHVDLDEVQLETGVYDVVCVFRFLKRDLMPQLRAAVRPGGRLIYQTFNIHRLDTMPDATPDYLLQPGELPGYVADWRLVYHAERGNTAQVVAVKPGAQ